MVFKCLQIRNVIECGRYILVNEKGECMYLMARNSHLFCLLMNLFTNQWNLMDFY